MMKERSRHGQSVILNRSGKDLLDIGRGLKRPVVPLSPSHNKMLKKNYTWLASINYRPNRVIYHT